MGCEDYKGTLEFRNEVINTRSILNEIKETIIKNKDKLFPTDTMLFNNRLYIDMTEEEISAEEIITKVKKVIKENHQLDDETLNIIVDRIIFATRTGFIIVFN